MTSNEIAPINWAVPILLTDGRSEIWVNYKYTFTSTITRQYPTTGDLKLLIASNQRSVTPIGIVLDRLEEYPHELETDPVTHRRILEWMRDEFTPYCPVPTEIP